MGTASAKQYAMPDRLTKNSKTKAKTPCKCLSCGKSHREIHDGKTLLICGDEACDLRCDRCTERPSRCSSYSKVVEIREREVAQA